MTQTDPAALDPASEPDLDGWTVCLACGSSTVEEALCFSCGFCPRCCTCEDWDDEDEDDVDVHKGEPPMRTGMDILTQRAQAAGKHIMVFRPAGGERRSFP
jgi:hypothetical protein